MFRPQRYKSPASGEMIWGEEVDARDCQPWRPSISAIRDAILAWRVTAIDYSKQMPLPPRARDFMPRQHEVDAVSEMCHEAVLAGRLIDFGDLPNSVIKDGGSRGGPLWNAGAYGQPFREPWLMFHTWEMAAALYLVNLRRKDDPTGDFEACELQPLMIGDRRILTISDRVVLEVEREGKPLPANKYRCLVAPSMLRFAPGEIGTTANGGDTPEGAAAGNVGDPMMTALMILNTRNIQRETISASEKLQKARRKSNKPPIPPYERINTAPYVTAVMLRGKSRPRSEPTGTHASPTPHIRMGHPRHYANGSRSFIRDTLVGVTDEARAEFLRSRSHYTIKH